MDTTHTHTDPHTPTCTRACAQVQLYVAKSLLTNIVLPLERLQNTVDIVVMSSNLECDLIQDLLSVLGQRRILASEGIESLDQTDSLVQSMALFTEVAGKHCPSSTPNQCHTNTHTHIHSHSHTHPYQNSLNPLRGGGHHRKGIQSRHCNSRRQFVFGAYRRMAGPCAGVHRHGRLQRTWWGVRCSQRP